MYFGTTGAGICQVYSTSTYPPYNIIQNIYIIDDIIYFYVSKPRYLETSTCNG